MGWPLLPYTMAFKLLNPNPPRPLPHRRTPSIKAGACISGTRWTSCRSLRTSVTCVRSRGSSAASSGQVGARSSLPCRRLRARPHRTVSGDARGASGSSAPLTRPSGRVASGCRCSGRLGLSFNIPPDLICSYKPISSGFAFFLTKPRCRADSAARSFQVGRGRRLPRRARRQHGSLSCEARDLLPPRTLHCDNPQEGPRFHEKLSGHAEPCSNFRASRQCFQHPHRQHLLPSL